jgi:hypothetical protein
MVDKRKHLMVAALDFGTTFSGYALKRFALKNK